MRLRQIEVFHAVYSHGSITNAATALNVSQPSVSKVLAHAEQQLGYRLFDRVKGKLIPTPEAHQLFKHVHAVYDDVDRLRHVAANLRDASAGRIRVASTPAFGLEILPRAVAAFREEDSGAVFEIETLHIDEIQDALLESRIDIGLAFDPPQHPGVRRKKLATARFFVLAHDRSGFGRRKSLSIEDVMDQPFIALNSRGPLGRALKKTLEAANVHPDIVAWTETYHVARALVGAGVGVTIADEITARSAVGANVAMYSLDPGITFDITLLQRGDASLSLAAGRFAKHLGKAVHEVLADRA